MDTTEEERQRTAIIDIKEEEWQCFCFSCDIATRNRLTRRLRFQIHGEEVIKLLSSSKDTTIITLSVGSEEVLIFCHKPLLCYFSEFFDAACYSGFSETSGLVKLPEENPVAIKIFVSWIYTGRIFGCLVPLEQLWVLGDRLRCPGFELEIMYHLFDKYDTAWMGLDAAVFTYSNTTEGSKLRRFVQDEIAADGPLHQVAIDRSISEGSSSWEAEWRDLIRGGGDLVVDVVVKGGFTNFRSKEDKKFGRRDRDNHSRYLPSYSTRCIKHIIKETHEMYQDDAPTTEVVEGRDIRRLLRFIAWTSSSL